MTTQTVSIPDIGDLAEVELTEILVRRGDRVLVDDSLVVLESDKASIEVPSPYPGEVSKVLAKVGDRLSKGAPLLEIRVEGGAGTEESEAAENTVTASPQGLERRESRAADTAAKISVLERRHQRRADDLLQNRGETYAGPAAHSMAREFGVDLNEIDGSASGGRVTRGDVREHLRAHFSGAGSAQLTLLNRTNVTALEKFCNSLVSEIDGSEPGLVRLAFVLKAVARALCDLPLVGESGVPSDSRPRDGLAWEIHCRTIAPRVTHVLTQQELLEKSGTEVIVKLVGGAAVESCANAASEGNAVKRFLVEDLGNLAVDAYIPVLNSIQHAAVLGLCRVRCHPGWNGATACQELPMSLSCNHRQIDSANAGALLTRVSELLTDIRRISL